VVLVALVARTLVLLVVVLEAFAGAAAGRSGEGCPKYPP